MMKMKKKMRMMTAVCPAPLVLRLTRSVAGWCDDCTFDMERRCVTDVVTVILSF